MANGNILLGQFVLIGEMRTIKEDEGEYDYYPLTRLLLFAFLKIICGSLLKLICKAITFAKLIMKVPALHIGANIVKNLRNGCSPQCQH